MIGFSFPMRTYVIPLVSGLALAVSVFLPWVNVGTTSLAGFPDTAALWVLGLGLTASLLATLSIVTRKNSRHPLLLVGLISLGITILCLRIIPQTVEERARIRSQAVAIVEHKPIGEEPAVDPGFGLYLGIAASAIITLFGLTIIVKRVSTTYAVTDPNDDI